MRARTFFVGIVAVMLVVTLANVSWADGRGRGWYPRPVAPSYYGWHGHPYPHPGYRYHYAPRPVYVPGPGAVYAPVAGPGYGGGYISGGISQPGLSFSFSVPLH